MRHVSCVFRPSSQAHWPIANGPVPCNFRIQHRIYHMCEKRAIKIKNIFFRPWRPVRCIFTCVCVCGKCGRWLQRGNWTDNSRRRRRVMGAIVMTFNDLTVNYFCTFFHSVLLLFGTARHCPKFPKLNSDSNSIRLSRREYLTFELKSYICNYRIFVNGLRTGKLVPASTHTIPQRKKV